MSLLNQETLVLNRSWVAITTTSVRDALNMLFTGNARAIQPETFETFAFDTWSALAVPPEEPCVRTVSMRIRVPEIVVLTHYGGTPRMVPSFSRRNLFLRDQNTCQYCGRKPGTKELSIDHVLPRSRGGLSTWTNCVLACVECNRRKANRLPEEVGMHLLKKPVTPAWTPIMEVPLVRVRQSWRRFVNDRYWNATLEA
ncbi:MAG: HNH endonuclease [Planctomycetota bacterium]